MRLLLYIDRISSEEKVEQVYGALFLKLLYGNDWITQWIGAPLLHTLVKNPFFSALYGFWQGLPITKSKIIPFIEQFEIDPTEFAEEVSSFCSFNDFFIRKLKPSARPIATGSEVAIIPADGRYRFFEDVSKVDGFWVKGEKFDLSTLLQNEGLAQKYAHGSMVMARLCPSDYHRFHFPVDCLPSSAQLINGWLYSVNPVALRRDIDIFTKNKRALTRLKTDHFGEILYLEIGATNVGSIHQTYKPSSFHRKGEEKGYFAFGASSLILLFEPGTIVFDEDLLRRSDLEIRCLMGQSMGKLFAPKGV